MPLNYSAEEQRFQRARLLQRTIFQLSALGSWRLNEDGRKGTVDCWCVSSRHRPRLIAGSMRTKRRPLIFLAKEIQLKPDLARKGWEYYTANRIWHPNAEISPEGLKFTMEIYAEQTEGSAAGSAEIHRHELPAAGNQELGEK